MNWTAIYRAGVVALLLLILGQMTGALDLRHDLANAARAIASAGREEERPAPPAARGGSFGSAHEDETIRALMNSAAPGASQPGQ
jgi:hypothetical protein